MRRGSIIPIIVILGVIVVGIAVVYFSKKISPTPSPKVLTDVEFRKRLQDLNERFGPVEKHPPPFPDSPVIYQGRNPKEVLNVPDDQLVGLKCSSIFDFQTKGWDQIGNSKLSALARKIATLAPTGQTFLLEFFCDTDKNQEFLAYAQRDGPSYDFRSLKYTIATVSGNQIDEVATIAVPYGYPSCSGPYQLTKSMTLYVECNGGDISSYFQFYKVDFNSKKVETVISCRRYGIAATGEDVPLDAPKDLYKNGVVNTCD